MSSGWPCWTFILTKSAQLSRQSTRVIDTSCGQLPQSRARNTLSSKIICTRARELIEKNGEKSLLLPPRFSEKSTGRWHYRRCASAYRVEMNGGTASRKIWSAHRPRIFARSRFLPTCAYTMHLCVRGETRGHTRDTREISRLLIRVTYNRKATASEQRDSVEYELVVV